MNFPIKILVIPLFLVLANSVNGQNRNDSIQSFLNNLKSTDFSGVILVAQNDSIIQQCAFGFASIEYNINNKIDTKFNIASITKMITAVAVLQLI